ncbi:L-rhamnose mutarotase [Compostimonas suwonensis]|uniref:L-rhamnose mutarotase n=1 Tax=Compostimonas suwonensis TaxID=1048394 RepID=A0A2M9BVN4_9MICO|nr:L-rhamnose mutarotase [Compostimonas suwonensis]PJJ62002.1 L-rhamnose mutarotase [Compostimonas suwonensis]
MHPDVDEFEFTTRLAAGRERAYEECHRAVPRDLDASMRDAGVLAWAIFRNGTVLTHRVVARDAEAMRAALDADPVNRRWQEEVAPFLDDGARPAPEPHERHEPHEPGALIWDLSWPVR